MPIKLRIENPNNRPDSYQDAERPNRDEPSLAKRNLAGWNAQRPYCLFNNIQKKPNTEEKRNQRKKEIPQIVQIDLLFKLT